jgi:hypothetical protein
MKKQFLAAAILAAVSFGAFAADETSTNTAAPKYTYVEADFSRMTLETGNNSEDVDFDGWQVRGSYEFGGDFHVFGGYQQSSNRQFDEFMDFDIEEAQIGLGWHPSVSDNADALLELSYIDQRVDMNVFGYDLGTDSTNMYRASAGFRAAFNDVLVGTLKANYTDGSDVDGEYTPSFALEARFNPMWSVVGEAELGNGMDRYTLGVRASF